MHRFCTQAPDPRPSSPTRRSGSVHRRRWARRLLGLALLPSAGGATGGIDAIGIEFENDLFAGVDRYYTNGVRLSWIRSGDNTPAWLHTVADWVPFFVRPEAPGRIKSGAGLGQNMYTPEDIERDPPDPQDRPYAGWLYLNANLAEDTGYRLDRLQLTLGIVGPASLAARTQEFVHDITGSPDPAGWDAQIGNEVTLMLGYERQLRSQASANASGWGTDITPHWGASVGSPFTFAHAGAIARAGYQLPRDYGPPRIGPGLPGSYTAPGPLRSGGYVFAGVDTRLMLFDLFLDGPVFRDGPSVDKYPLIGEFTAGFVMNVRTLRLGYTHVWRSREFQGQATGPIEWGTLHATWQF